jgi:hypothetical protein
MAADILDRTLKGPQEIAPGITFEWVSDGYIVILKVGTVARESLEQYAQQYIRLVNDASAAQPFLVMVDSTSPDFSFTPTLRQKITEMEDAVPDDLPGRLALLLEDSVKSQVFRLVLRGINLTYRRKKLQRGIYVNQDEAFTWLQDGIPN